MSALACHGIKKIAFKMHPGFMVYNPKTVEEIILTEPKDVRDNLDPVYEQLVDAIEGAPLLIKPEETLRVMKVMEAAFEGYIN